MRKGNGGRASGLDTRSGRRVPGQRRGGFNVNDDQTISLERAGQRQPRSGAFDGALVKLLLQGFKGVPVGFLLWDGTRFPSGLKRPVAWFRVHDRQALLQMALNPDLQMGELYSAGRLDVDGSLVDLGEVVYRVSLTSTVRGPLAALAALQRFVNRPRGSGERQSRKNIQHHYDIGNDFYRLWLDEQLVYTCAYFPDPSASLEEAQIAKMDHVCRKLGLQARGAGGRGGVRLGGPGPAHGPALRGARSGPTTSRDAQLAYARERAQTEGLADRVEFIEDDYREISGGLRRLRLGRHAGARGARALWRPRRRDRSLPRARRAGTDPLHRPQPSAPR